MTVNNIHKRIINQPKQKISSLLDTLATKDDAVWPKELWPRMKFKQGLEKGAIGHHGPIHYSVNQYNDSGFEFKFIKPVGFHGVHGLAMTTLNSNQTELVYYLKMDARGLGLIKWLFAIRQLHNALIEDAFDKVENHFDGQNRKSSWSLWVRFLRLILK